MIRQVLILSACSAAALFGCKKAKVTPTDVTPPSETAAVQPVAPAPATSESTMAFATATLASKTGALSGTLTFTAVPIAGNDNASSLIVTADLTNATPGDHGIHIHEFGDCSGEDFASAGTHLNPAGVEHAGPTDAVHHLGDLGNIKVDENGNGQLTETLSIGDHGVAAVEDLIVGKAVILHEANDDLKTQPSGNSGKPIACGVITKAESTAH